MTDENFELEVAAIFPSKNGVGTVRFRFRVPVTKDDITIDLPYSDETGPTDGVKEAAGYLENLAGRIAEAAQELAK